MRNNEMEAKSSYDIKFVLITLLLAQYLTALFLVGVDIYFVIPFVAMLFIAAIDKDLLDTMCINIFLLMACLLLVIANKEFIFIPQAEELLKENPSVVHWFVANHVHAIRLFIAYPGYILSEILEITLNGGFSYYCLIIFILFYRNLLAAIKLYRDTVEGYVQGAFFLLCGTLFLLYTMNGRIIFAFYGISLILLCNVQLYKGCEFTPKHVVMLFVGVLCTTVSSGTLIVGLLTAILGVICSHQGKKIFLKKWVKILMLFSIPVIIIFSKYVIRMLIKNIDFFGGGIKGAIGMLGHGLGKFVYIGGQYIAVLILLLAIIFIVFNIIFVLYLYKKRTKLLPIFISINISLYGSLFGLSTGATALVGLPLLIAISIDFIKRTEMRKKTNYVNV